MTKTETDFVISLNDRNIPPLRINKAYKDLMSKRKKNGVSAEAKDFIRQRFEAAKWFISSIHQRRETMLKVMRTIVEKQHEYFDTGEGLRPMIYKDIAEVISMDISTISRVVNSKYVQTDYGVFSLRHFFSDSISTTDGDEVSNKEVKKKLKTLIDAEDPLHPLSDHKLARDAEHRRAEHRPADGGEVPRSDAHPRGPPPPQTHLSRDGTVTTTIHATTVLGLTHNGVTVIGADGQVTLGQTVMKHTARKVRRLYNGKVIAGFAGAAADAFTLFAKFEDHLEKHRGQPGAGRRGTGPRMAYGQVPPPARGTAGGPRRTRPPSSSPAPARSSNPTTASWPSAPAAVLPLRQHACSSNTPPSARARSWRNPSGPPPASASTRIPTSSSKSCNASGQRSP